MHYKSNPQLALAGLVLVLLLNGIFRMVKLSRVCVNCGEVVCHRCQIKSHYVNICLNCQSLQDEHSSLEPFDKVYLSDEVNRRHKLLSNLSIFFSFLLPGTGHYIVGKSFTGLMISVVFFVFVLKIFFFNGIIIDRFDLSLTTLFSRYIIFYSLFAFFYGLIISNIFYEVKLYNER